MGSPLPPLLDSASGDLISSVHIHNSSNLVSLPAGSLLSFCLQLLSIHLSLWAETLPTPTWSPAGDEHQVSVLQGPCLAVPLRTLDLGPALALPAARDYIFLSFSVFLDSLAMPSHVLAASWGAQEAWMDKGVVWKRCCIQVVCPNVAPGPSALGTSDWSAPRQCKSDGWALLPTLTPSTASPH